MRALVRVPTPINIQLPILTTISEDDPSRRTAAAGLLASLEDRSSSPLTTYRPPNPVSENSDSANSANSIRLPTGSQKYSNSPTSAGAERIASLITKAQARKRPTGRAPGQPSMSTVQELENAKRASDLSRQITRRWKAGDVYAPHDLSAVEMAKWKSRGKPTHDVFDVLDFNPLEHYRVRTTLFSLPILLCLFATLCLIALDYELGPGKSDC